MKTADRIFNTRVTDSGVPRVSDAKIWPAYFTYFTWAFFPILKTSYWFIEW